MLIIGLLIFFNKSLMKEMIKLTSDKVFLFVSGFLSLILGLFTVLLHNLWVSDWRVIITIFGWLALLKGILILGCPDFTKRISKHYNKNLSTANVQITIMVIVALYVTLKGFGLY
ncbi:hypothetical protein HOK68_00970 [Candidatus Woesearchaeota archaeon]|nr:hypothetical protein [Candidatus Woesearchaeota archaeon]MBT4595938.1 hypothetical protein [Candidatus Woesearchaeota archaeon]MBT5741068.1 hypothetical protein [Candidatus Woesearchaeota archaeon]MBT6505332.1 hypothetical protein [Candidatus Woesearchaeota archaeon]MBT7297017.1 hypothetical protein [Candidatus Woesearchaeota archaeon]